MAKAAFKKPAGLTPDVCKIIVRLGRRGLPFVDAVIKAGLSERTGHYWKADAEEHGEASPCFAVFAAHKKAQIELKLRLLDAVVQAPRVDPKYWVAAMTLLERLDPDNFGRRERVDLGNQGDNPLKVLIEWSGNGNGNGKSKKH
jgi:hypothetical protein